MFQFSICRYCHDLCKAKKNVKIFINILENDFYFIFMGSFTNMDIALCYFLLDSFVYIIELEYAFL